MSNDPTGYTTRPSADGSGTELIPISRRSDRMGALFMTLFALAWNAGVWAFILAALRGSQSLNADGGADSPLLWLPAVFAVLGIVLACGAAYAIFYCTVRWAVGPGWLARRGRIPLLGLERERRYGHLDHLEIRHGIWDNGCGASTDILRLWEISRRKPVTIREVSYRPGIEQIEARFKNRIPSPGAVKEAMQYVQATAEKTVPVSPQLLELGSYLSGEAGVRLEITEEIIRAPSDSSGSSGPPTDFTYSP